MASGSPASNWRKGRALAGVALAWWWSSAADAPPTDRQTGAASSAVAAVKPKFGPVAPAQPGVAGCPIPLNRDLHYLAQAGVVLDNPQQPALTASWAYSLRALQRHADGTTVVAARIRRTDESAAGSPPWPDVSPAFLLRLGADCAHLAYAWQRDADLEGAGFQQGRAAMFAQLQAADPSGERIAQGLRYLEAWLLANPAGADQLRDWLRTQSERYTNNPWARMALAALGRCGLPQARAALRSLAQDPKLASAMRLHALLNLASAEGLDSADGEFLRDRARERVAHGLDTQASQDSASALTALGMVARHPNLQGTPIQAAAIDDLRAALRTETDETYLQAAVNGAGNAADPALLAELEPLSHHANSDIRRRVADALRGMPAEAIEAWFAPWLAREEAPAVAAQLIAAYPLHYGPGAAVPAAVLQPALVAQFAAESARGAAAEAAVLQAIGAYVGAAELAGAK